MQHTECVLGLLPSVTITLGASKWMTALNFSSTQHSAWTLNYLLGEQINKQSLKQTKDQKELILTVTTLPFFLYYFK